MVECTVYSRGKMAGKEGKNNQTDLQQTGIDQDRRDLTRNLLFATGGWAAGMITRGLFPSHATESRGDIHIDERYRDFTARIDIIHPLLATDPHFRAKLGSVMDAIMITVSIILDKQDENEIDNDLSTLALKGLEALKIITENGQKGSPQLTKPLAQSLEELSATQRFV